MESEDCNQAWATTVAGFVHVDSSRGLGSGSEERHRQVTKRQGCETSRLVVGGYVDVQDCRGQHQAPVTH